MPFDRATFEAEVALKLIPTERLPSVAQDALEAGFDGPRVVRMAVLEPVANWGIDQALPPMMEELGCKAISPEDAALHLARQRARQSWRLAKILCRPCRTFTVSCWRLTASKNCMSWPTSTTTTSSTPTIPRRSARVPVKHWRSCFPQSCVRDAALRDKLHGSRNRRRSKPNGLTS